MKKSIFYLLLLAFALLPGISAAATKYWIGSAGGAFSTAANWTTTAGSACGVNANTTAPGAGDIAAFVSDCTNSAVISGAASVAGINMAAGSLTQNTGQSPTLTVGASGFTQSGGSFTGGNTAISLGGLDISGGSFTSTSGTLTMGGNFSLSSGTFSHNNGTFKFFYNAASQALSFSGTQSLYNVTVGGGANSYSNTLTLAGGTTLTVKGTLSFAGLVVAPDIINGGAIIAEGDLIQSTYGTTGSTVVTVAGSGTQTLTGGGGVTANLPPLIINKPAGTLTLVGTITTLNNWTYIAGTLDAGTSTLKFFKSNSMDNSLTLSGTQSLYNVTVGGGASSHSNTLTLAGGTTLTVKGTLSFAGLVVSPDIINGGAIIAEGDLIQGAY
ncbi:hypothetical protein, partial [Propionivibrio sp.]|uniref:hypothetical protein n=1 Tax=Propionivibrio sp. TaxID=2212460 RepID=UPI00261E0FB9